MVKKVSYTCKISLIKLLYHDRKILLEWYLDVIFLGNWTLKQVSSTCLLYFFYKTFLILLQVTIGFSEDMDVKRPDDLDMQILRNIRATSGRSKKMVGELKNLKSKIYGIENDLKHL